MVLSFFFQIHSKDSEINGERLSFSAQQHVTGKQTAWTSFAAPFVLVRPGGAAQVMLLFGTWCSVCVFHLTGFTFTLLHPQISGVSLLLMGPSPSKSNEDSVITGKKSNTALQCYLPAITPINIPFAFSRLFIARRKAGRLNLI